MPPEDRIARAALALASERGLDAVTFGLVAAEAGVSKGAVQHHFPARADLLRASAGLLLRHVDARVHRAFVAARDPQERLVALLAAALPRTPDELDLAFAATSLLVVTRHDAAVRTQYAAGLARARAAVAAEVSDLVPAVDVEAVASAVLGVAGSLREEVMLGVIGPRVARRRLVALVGALVARG
ncbi:TetR/AcrR family transcriptional regulator [Lapillicoccus sp.]|uniref:TetR/AcrR family transcriptional regulator n=1 Tax=Lapillicoccus sp. TaxID=1909287 RepID=UPI0025E06E44|nr:TetR/AcrR family transcriptional regulator [Lapillicoccus sp.]